MDSAVGLVLPPPSLLSSSHYSSTHLPLSGILPNSDNHRTGRQSSAGIVVAVVVSCGCEIEKRMMGRRMEGRMMMMGVGCVVPASEVRARGDEIVEW